MNYMGVIFDFNGTLFFDSDKQELAWKTTSEMLRGFPLSKEEMSIWVHGRNNKDTFEYLLNKKLTKEEVEIYAEKKETIYRELCKKDVDNFKLVNGSKELFEYCEKNNIPYTIATASGLENVNFFIKSFNLEKWFDIDKIIYDDGSIPGKPNPDIYIKACNRIAIDPKNAIVFEDAKSGIMAAKNAKIGKIISMVTNENEEEYKKIEGVSKFIKDFTELNFEELFS